MKWISVNERLPDDMCDKLVFDIRSETQCQYISYYNPQENNWKRTVDKKPIKVTHWMPLPEPPKS